MNYQLRNGKELTEEQYIAYLEGLALGIYYAINTNDEGELNCHGKLYDPLYISHKEQFTEDWVVHSYVFDFHDGGRHHKFSSLQDIENALILELELAMRNNE